jgi:predicted RND superfamily exporter protein
MTRGGLSLIPHLLIGLLLTTLFVLITVMASSLHNGHFDWNKVLIAAGIVLSPLFAVLTTFGITSFAGIEIYPIQMVIPFLILAIGISLLTILRIIHSMSI